MQELYKETILDHYQNPRSKGPLACATHHADGKNPLCGDEVTLQLTIQDGVVEHVGWDGHGCSICMASASMLAEQLPGKKLADVEQIAAAFTDLLHGTPRSVELGDLEALEGVKQFPVRIKCALLPWTTLREALKG